MAMPVALSSVKFTWNRMTFELKIVDIEIRRRAFSKNFTSLKCVVVREFLVGQTKKKIQTFRNKIWMVAKETRSWRMLT